MKKQVKIEVSAGGIVFKKTKKGLFIAFILDPFNKWTFAKGHAEKGEKSELAALRETEEETGFKNLKVIDYLGKIDFWFKDVFKEKGKTIHKFVYYYLMEAPVDAVAKPQKYEKIQEVKWVSVDKALEFSSYKDVEKVLKKAVNLIKNL
ncbi:MAG: NUDIX domain-containing protein [Patescibacteria group bacterium]|nr:NUDIX domain-containing protein [Patescibacteria group bacterium]